MEINAADQIPFNLVRIPGVGHSPKVLKGTVFPVPSSRIQSPLAFELLRPGKEITIDSWPDGEVFDDSISLLPSLSRSAVPHLPDPYDFSISSSPPL